MAPPRTLRRSSEIIICIFRLNRHFSRHSLDNRYERRLSEYNRFTQNTECPVGVDPSSRKTNKTTLKKRNSTARVNADKRKSNRCSKRRRSDDGYFYLLPVVFLNEIINRLSVSKEKKKNPLSRGSIIIPLMF